MDRSHFIFCHPPYQLTLWNSLTHLPVQPLLLPQGGSAVTGLRRVSQLPGVVGAGLKDVCALAESRYSGHQACASKHTSQVLGGLAGRDVRRTALSAGLFLLPATAPCVCVACLVGSACGERWYPCIKRNGTLADDQAQVCFLCARKGVWQGPTSTLPLTYPWSVPGWKVCRGVASGSPHTSCPHGELFMTAVVCVRVRHLMCSMHAPV
jgi:hypothetical protein